MDECRIAALVPELRVIRVRPVAVRQPFWRGEYSNMAYLCAVVPEP